MHKNRVKPEIKENSASDVSEEFVETCPLVKGRGDCGSGRTRKFGMSERCELDRQIVQVIITQDLLADNLQEICII